MRFRNSIEMAAKIDRSCSPQVPTQHRLSHYPGQVSSRRLRGFEVEASIDQDQTALTLLRPEAAVSLLSWRSFQPAWAAVPVRLVVERVVLLAETSCSLGWG